VCLRTLRGNSTSPALGVLPNGYESPQGQLPKTKSCVYRDTRANRVLRILLRLVDVHVFTERWSGHSKLSKKKKRLTCPRYRDKVS
jgi:hypothetical protein